MSLDYLFDKVLALNDVGFLLWVGLFVLNTVNLVVKFGVLDLQVGLLHEVRYLFKLVKGVIWVMKHNAVEYLSEMCVKVKLDGAAHISGLFQLGLNAL